MDGTAGSAHAGVLVTGSHRSGSTWVGRILAASRSLHYVQEPFNIVAHQRWLEPPPPQQFFYVHSAVADTWRARYQRVVDLKPPLVRPIVSGVGSGRSKLALRLAKGAAQARRRNAAPLIKDPIAVFSTEWLADTFGLRPVVLIREPVAFAGSLQERNWRFDFQHWTKQTELMHELLDPWAEGINRMVALGDEADVVDQAIVQWNAIYGHVADLRERHPEWVFVRYEDLAARPADVMPGLFAALDLDFGDKEAAAVDALSTTKRQESSAIDVRRNSEDALRVGRTRLEPSAIERVRAGTAEVAQRFYPEEFGS